MKELSKVINNLNLTKKDDHTLQNKVPPIVKSIVDSLFDQLAFVFPAWKYTWDTEEKIKGAKKEWVKSFFENDINTKEQIACGLKKARKTNADFIPSCGKFISWCKPSPEDLGYPSEQAALTKCVSHRNKIKMNMPSYESNFIIELVKQVNWWLMNQATDQMSQKKADKHFKEVYLNLTVNYKELLESESARLEVGNIVKDRMSEQQLEDGRKRGLDALKDIKSKLKRKTNDVEIKDKQ